MTPVFFQSLIYFLISCVFICVHGASTVGPWDPYTDPTGMTILSFTPKEITVSPIHGPISGGTKLTVKVGDKNKELLLLLGPFSQVDAVMIGKHGIILIEWHGDSILLLTPKGNEVYKKLPISLLFKDGSVIHTPYTFTYKPDPTISEIYPLETITSGGTKVTVTGTNLDAVADPALSLTLSAKDTQATTPQVKLTSPCDKESVQYEKMICQTPNTTGHISPDELADYNFYLGLKLDGVPTYTDLADTLPQYSQLQVFADPSFLVFEGEKMVESGESLLIEGESMDKGCGREDYTILIGDGQCQIEQLVENELQCLPPDSAPTQKANEVSLGENRFYLTVQVGFSTVHQIGVVRYKPSNTKLYFIIGCSVGGALVIIVGIISCVLTRERHKSEGRRKKYGEENYPMDTSSGLGAVGNEIDRGGEQSRHVQPLPPLPDYKINGRMMLPDQPSGPFSDLGNENLANENEQQGVRGGISRTAQARSTLDRPGRSLPDRARPDLSTAEGHGGNGSNSVNQRYGQSADYLQVI